MTEQEAREAKERADMIVNKVRDLVALEDKVLETREVVHQLSINGNDISPDDLQKVPIAERQNALAALEAQLKESVEELDGITDELKWTTPCFRAYVLPQMSEIVGTLKACDAADRSELTQLVTSLTDEENSQSPEELEEAIVTRLKANLERTFSAG